MSSRQLCYLEAICTKVPQLVQREKMGVDSKGNQICQEGLIVQGNFEAEEGMELS
jgi:hypothetical protein